MASKNEEEYEKAIAAYFDERSRAYDRMLASAWSFSESAIIWALAFAKIDLKRFGPIEWQRLQYEIDVVARLGPQAGMAIGGEWPHHALYDVPTPTWPETILDRLPSKDTVRKLQKDLRDHLQNIVSRSQTKLALPADTSLSYHFITAVPPRRSHPGYRLARERPRQKEKEFFVSRALAAPLPIAFQYHILETMHLHPGRIRHCTACRKLFFAQRKHREYCSDQCRARTNIRLKRNISPDRYGKPGRRSSTGVERNIQKKNTRKMQVPKKGGRHGSNR